MVVECNLDPSALLLTEGEKSSGKPGAKCLLIGFREEQSKASLIGAFVSARGVSRQPIFGFKNLTAHVFLHRDSQSLG